MCNECPPKPAKPSNRRDTTGLEYYYEALREWKEVKQRRHGRSSGGARNTHRENPRTSTNFGNGQVGGDRDWTAPVHGTTGYGQDVTVTFGQGYRDGHTGIASGHVDGASFYGGYGHDHYGESGQLYADRDAYKE